MMPGFATISERRPDQFAFMLTLLKNFIVGAAERIRSRFEG
jgi:hypothetical protein